MTAEEARAEGPVSNNQVFWDLTLKTSVPIGGLSTVVVSFTQLVLSSGTLTLDTYLLSGPEVAAPACRSTVSDKCKWLVWPAQRHTQASQ